MRTTLKIVITLVVLGGGFAAYLMFQSNSVPRTSGSKPARQAVQPLKPNDGRGVLGEGERVWVKQYDKQGRPSSQFRAEKYEPQQDGTVRVTLPEAILFLKGKGALPKVKITGKSGEVVVQTPPDVAGEGLPGKGGGRAAGPAAPPSSGRLNDVEIAVFEDQADAEPVVIVRTNNITFDNETFRISTESYVEGGKTVPADQVRVEVTGRDYEFFGRGLTVRWNDLDERLDLLKIAHGEKLVIKDPRAFSGALPGQKKEPGDAKPHDATTHDMKPQGAKWQAARRPVAMADVSADRARQSVAPQAGEASVVLVAGEAPAPAARTPAEAPARKQKKDRDTIDLRPARLTQPPYRATFNDAVRITEGEQTVAAGDRMHVDFVPEQPSPATQQAANATPSPTPPPKAVPAPEAAVALDAASAPEAGSAPEAVPAPEAAVARKAAPAPHATADTQPAQPHEPSASQPATQTLTPPIQPITVYWSGELVVTPSTPAAPPAAPSPEAPPKLAPGEAAVELIGVPLLLTRDRGEIRCGSLTYRTGDGSLSLWNSEQFPQVLVKQLPALPAAADNAQPAGGERAATPATETTLNADSIHYSPAQRLATLKGRGHATGLLTGEGGQAQGVMDARWRDGAKFFLVGEDREEMSIERAEFAGDVDMNHPQGVVRAQKLELAFDPAGPPAPPKDKPAPVKHSEKPEQDPAPETPPAESVEDRPAPVEADGPAVEQRAALAARPAAAPSRPQPILRRVIATEKVFCQLKDAPDRTQTVECDRLELETAASDDGEFYPRIVDARGAVHAYDAKQDLRAGSVLLTLAPARKPAAPVAPEGKEAARHETGHRGAVDETLGGTAEDPPLAATASVELQSMLAETGVTVKSADGSTAQAESVHITHDGRGPQIELTGEPAKVTDAKGNTLSGPRILVSPETGQARVVGPGTLHGMQSQSAQDAPRPVDVKWEGGTLVDGGRDQISVTGKVAVTVTDPADGSVTTANGERISIQLVKKTPAAPAGGAAGPATRPAKQGKGRADGSERTALAGLRPSKQSAKKDVADNAAALAPTTGPDRLEKTGRNKQAGRGRRPKGPATQPAQPAAAPAGSVNMDLFKDKEIGTITIEQGAVVTNSLIAPDGQTLLREFRMQAPKIRYDVLKQRLVVPGPGQMLVRDYRPPEQNAKGGTKGAAASSKGKGKDPINLAAGRGTTAFQWGKALVYDEAAQRATMTGEVVVVSEPEGKDQQPVRLDADKLVAAFDPAPEAMKKPAPPADQAGLLRLKSLTAEGNILITRGPSELTADHILFDPQTDWIVARGTDRSPAVYSDAAGGRSTTAAELWMNTRTWDIRVKDASARVGG